MAKKTTTTVEDDSQPESPAVEDARETVAGIEAELSNETVARIHRTHPSLGSGKEHYCGQVDAKLVSPDYLQSQYGGGQYRIQTMGPMPGKGGKIRIGPLKQFRMEVDPSIPPKNPLGQQPSHMPTQQGGLPTTSNLNELMILQVIESINATRKMETAAIERLVQQPQGPRIDWSPVIAAAIAAVPSVLSALSQRKDPFELATKLLENMKPPEAAPTSLDQMSQFLDVAAKIGARMNGSGEEKAAGMWDTMKEFAPVLQQLLAGRGTDAGVELPSNEMHSLPPAPQQPEPVPLPPSIALLAPLLPRLLADAQIGRNPETCADYYLSEVPPGHYGSLRAVVSASTLVADLTKALPEFTPYAVWLEDLRKALVESLSDDDTEEK